MDARNVRSRDTDKRDRKVAKKTEGKSLKRKKSISQHTVANPEGRIDLGQGGLSRPDWPEAAPSYNHEGLSSDEPKPTMSENPGRSILHYHMQSPFQLKTRISKFPALPIAGPG